MPVFSFSFAVYTVLSENTHTISIMYNEACMFQGENRPHCIASFLRDVVSTWSTLWQAS